jgi:hypothetical protein
MTGTWRFPLLVAVVIIGLALGYSLLLSLGVLDYARNTIHYYWGCPSGKVMAEDYSCVQPTFYPENRPSGEKRE